eukprot:m.207998 g.207998  ORF g.207998 m.207998 type:complete len:87 (+) comp23993_c0_seq1:1068-1328(+)
MGWYTNTAHPHHALVRVTLQPCIFLSPSILRTRTPLGGVYQGLVATMTLHGKHVGCPPAPINDIDQIDTVFCHLCALANAFLARGW